MKILIIGSGGREHALGFKAAQNKKVSKVYIAPGNAGTAQEDKLENINIKSNDIDSLVLFAQEKRIDLTIVGPEEPLVNGIVDIFNAKGLAIFGPDKKAAQLEGSKVFAKKFLSKYKIPTAEYAAFTKIEPAIKYIHQQSLPLVIKADGLAAGKGVIIALTHEDAEQAVIEMLTENRFGKAGKEVVIEEYLEGEEASFIVVTDGKTIVPMATSQDHKRVGDGDTGLNTGGMGAYSPALVVTPYIENRIMEDVIQPTIKGMEKEGMPYTGFLYAGLMIMPDGSPKVIEFNCRLGDPETQPIMMRMKSDLIEICHLALSEQLDKARLDWDLRACIGVVLAAKGYPDAYNKGKQIELLEPKQTDLKIFHAGTQLNENGKISIEGGRVLCVTALGDKVLDAKQKAYDLIKQIDCPHLFCRFDIGYKAIEREE